MGTWKTCKLGDVAEYVKKRYPVKALTLDNYVSTENVLPNRGGRVVASTLPKTGTVIAWQTGDVLIPNIRPYFKKIWLGRGTGGASADVMVIRARKGQNISPRLLYYWLSSDAFFAHVMAGANGAKMPRGDKNHTMLFEFPLPPFEEQERIAGALGAYDDLIEVNERRMTLLEEAAYRLYRDRFVTHADPTWERKPLSDVCTTIQSGGTPSRSEGRFWESGTIDWFKTKELEDNWLLASEERITEAGLRQSSTRLYPAGTILMAIYASPTLGRLGVLDHEATCNQAALGFVVDETLASRWWLFHTLRSERDKFNQVARGAGQQNISGDIVQGWEVPMPPPAVMRDFEEKVGVYWEAARMLSRENALLRAGRDKLVPRLLREEA